MNILFVGNSLTYCNDLPDTIAALAKSRGIDVRIGRYIRGGASLKDHWLDNAGVSENREEDMPREKATLPFDPERQGQLDELLKESWDIAVLQGQSQETIFTPENFLNYGRKLIEKCRNAGVKRVVLYLNWAHKHLPQTQMTITGYFTDLAEAAGAECVPAGEAFRWLRQQHPEIELFVEDGYHPNPNGTYLTACCFLAALMDQSPRSLPHELPDVQSHQGAFSPYENWDPKTAECLQIVAEQTIAAWRAGQAK